MPYLPSMLATVSGRPFVPLDRHVLFIIVFAVIFGLSGCAALTGGADAVPKTPREQLVVASVSIEGYTKTVTDLTNRRVITVAQAEEQLAKIKKASAELDRAWMLVNNGNMPEGQSSLAQVNATLDLVLLFLEPYAQPPGAK